MKELENDKNAADSSVESRDLLGSLDVAYDLANHGIPFYAYGDNEAACDMASRLEQIGHELRYVRDLIRIEAKINKLTELPTADREPEELPESPTSLHQSIVLPLYHDRNKYADWGWVRDQTGAIVYIAQTPCGADADAHRRNKTDPAQTRVDALLQAFEIVQRLAEWSAKYPRQQVHSFSAKVDEQLIEIENAAKAWLDGKNAEMRNHPTN